MHCDRAQDDMKFNMTEISALFHIVMLSLSKHGLVLLASGARVPFKVFYKAGRISIFCEGSNG